MRLLISAGEASGDTYGAALLGEMRRLGLPSGTSVEAVGGKKLRAAGAEILSDSSQWGSMGISQVLKIYFRALRGLNTAKRAMVSGPGLLIAIDFGYMNIRLASHAKRHGWKVLYFMPPGSWRRDRQGSDLPSLTDAISTPFEWSAELLKGAGANAFWFGHPIKQLMKEAHPSEQGDRSTIAVLPGSRLHEIELNTPLIAKALQHRAEIFEFAVAPTADAESLRRLWIRHSGRTQDRFVENDLYGVLSRAKAAVVCSGTATLEAALCDCPMVVVYKVTKLMHLEAYLAGLKGKFISLPNILLDRWVVVEMANSEIDPIELRRELESLIDDKERRSAQLRAFTEIRVMLGSDDAITKTAELALGLLS